MANYGVKVSEPGFDIATATDKNLILKSDLTMLKVVASGSVALSSGWNEIAHNLGYVPQFLVYINDKTNTKTYFGAGDSTYGLARTDTTKLYINFGSGSDTAYYYIFYEAA